MLNFSRTTIACFAIGISLFLLLTSNTTHLPPKVAESGQSFYNYTTAELAPKHLRVLIIAPQNGTGICKTVISASALGYPPPNLIEWRTDWRGEYKGLGNETSNPIGGMQDFFNDLESTHDEDLILVVDGYKTLFQLKPQTLLNRYFEINKQANSRFRTSFNGTADYLRIDQRIVFSSTKRCTAGDPSGAACAIFPESSLPQDIYGPETDRVIPDDEQRMHSRMRQKFLTSGVILGSVADLRVMFNRTEEVVRSGSEQEKFTQIFTQQESWRSYLKAEPPSLSLLEQGNTTAMRNARELGIGLDYESQLSFVTDSAEEDAGWRILSNRSSSMTTQTDSIGSISLTLQQDLAHSLPPYWAPTSAYAQHSITWGDVPLLTNLWTGITPAIVHHNSQRGDMRNVMEDWWKQVWYHRDLPAIWENSRYEPTGPVAFAGGRYWYPAYLEAIPGDVIVKVRGKWKTRSVHDVCSKQDLDTFLGPDYHDRNS